MDHSLFDSILPRYVRKAKFPGRGDTQGDAIHRSGIENSMTIPKRVKWSSHFFALPRFLPLSVLCDDRSESYRSKGFFPMDIASSLATLALLINFEMLLDKGPPKKLLDLCCCPGGKLQMLSEELPPDALVVGVDISDNRLNVCKAQMREWNSYIASSLKTVFQATSKEHISNGSNKTKRLLLNREERPTPRQLIFKADGTVFGPSNIGTLVYDSDVFYGEWLSSNCQRKKMNKSARSREEKQLLVLQECLQRAQDAPTSQITHSGAHVGSDNFAALPADDQDHQKEKEENSILACCRMCDFDFVLVDAECTHDASYRHMKYIPSSTNPNDLVSGAKVSTTGTTGGQQVVATHGGNAGLNVPHTEFHGILQHDHEIKVQKQQGYVDKNVATNVGEGTRKRQKLVTKPTAVLSHAKKWQPASELAPESVDISTGDYCRTDSRGDVITGAGSSGDGSSDSIRVPPSSLVRLQRSLLQNGFKRLRPGGSLVYCTCSHQPAQNEEVVQWLLASEPMAQLVRVDSEFDAYFHKDISGTLPAEHAILDGHFALGSVAKADDNGCPVQSGGSSGLVPVLISDIAQVSSEETSEQYRESMSRSVPADASVESIPREFVSDELPLRPIPTSLSSATAAPLLTLPPTSTSASVSASTSSCQLPSKNLLEYFQTHSAAEVLQALSADSRDQQRQSQLALQLCQEVADSPLPYYECSELLPGAVRVGYTGGMSGHFIAKVTKIAATQPCMEPE